MTHFEGKDNDEDMWSLIMMYAQLVKLLIDGRPLYLFFGGRVIYGQKNYQVYFHTQQKMPLFDFHDFP
jgi:hypothetical protein